MEKHTKARPQRPPACWLLGAILVGVGQVGDARAEPQWRVGAGTDAPLDVHLSGEVTWPSRVSIYGSLGMVPPGYIHMANEVVITFGGWSESTGQVVESALQRSLSSQVGLRWQPWSKVGFRIGAGYQNLALGGGATTEELLVAMTGVEMPTEQGRFGVLSEEKEWDLSAKVHLLRAELSYRIPFGEHWAMETGLGGAFTLGAKAQLAPTYEPRFPAASDLLAEEGEAWLEENLERYLHTPSLRVGVHYQF
jgi:hypothetical protein